MMPTTPYLIRAIYEWCSDQGLTPHLLVDASFEGVVVPRHLVENESIVLNIQASAVRSLDMGNEWVSFNTRFSGKVMDVFVPVSAIRAIFARENGIGCAFELSPDASSASAGGPESERSQESGLPSRPAADKTPAVEKKRGSKVDSKKTKEQPGKATKKESHLKLV